MSLPDKGGNKNNPLNYESDDKPRVKIGIPKTANLFWFPALVIKAAVIITTGNTIIDLRLAFSTTFLVVIFYRMLEFLNSYLVNWNLSEASFVSDAQCSLPIISHTLLVKVEGMELRLNDITFNQDFWDRFSCQNMPAVLYVISSLPLKRKININ